MIEKKKLAELRKENTVHEGDNWNCLNCQTRSIVITELLNDIEAIRKENAELKAAYDEASTIAKKWAERGKQTEKLEAVARAAEEWRDSINACFEKDMKKKLIEALSALKDKP